MKTNSQETKTNTNSNSNQNSNTGLLTRPEQSGTEPKVKAPAKQLPRISLKRRFANRALNTDKLVNLLRNEAPRFFEVAEVVGKWVWIQFSERQPAEITSELSELGFHWNNRRQVWQHPCGTMPERADYDPRKRYGSYFAADRQTA